MYLKSLSITNGDGETIREIRFHTGLNLIVDETPFGDRETGNNVGKTTVLKLIDFCFGAKAKEIYSEQENKKHEYKLVKDFLISNRVIVSIILKADLINEESLEVIIERNFLQNKNKIQRINGKNIIDDKSFENSLINILFPNHQENKPTLRQIISHNIRYKDLSISNTLKNLNTFTRDDEYETLYLFLFGCNFEQGDSKQELRSKIDIEEKFKKRLESEQTKSAYETALAILQSEIEELELKKASLNLNPNFESNLDELNRVKYQVNVTSSEISKLELRKDLILEAQQEMQTGKSAIDVQQLQQIYNQATSLVTGIQKTFQELNDFHNRMVESKIRFIVQDLPRIYAGIIVKREHLNRLLAEEAKLSSAIIRSDSFEVLEKIIEMLNTKHHTKGEYENTLRQLNTVESKLAELNKNLAEIDNELFSDEFVLKIKEQVNKFNRHFSSVSNELYGEKYALKFDTKTMKGRRLYEFTAFNTNFSSGKKQGEISCFDIAYTLFADEENIPCMHFLLNDKKELMHDNQLMKIANLSNTKKIQFVASILKDKLPEELNKDEYIIVKLSQEDKLFRIENIKEVAQHT